MPTFPSSPLRTAGFPRYGSKAGISDPAVVDFYFQASNGSVAVPVAGHNYNSDWTSLLVRLSLTGMAASLAAPDLLTKHHAKVSDPECIRWL
jgi:hypothetical protein